jgi:hypothetical protein
MSKPLIGLAGARSVTIPAGVDAEIGWLKANCAAPKVTLRMRVVGGFKI